MLPSVTRAEHGPWTSYTPTLTATTTNPTIGNGTLTGFYKLLDPKTCLVRIYWQFGSTSAAGSGTYSFAIPFTSASVGGNQVMAGVFTDSGTGFYACVGRIAASATTLGVTVADSAGGRSLTEANPVAWATNDSIGLEGIYEIA